MLQNQVVQTEKDTIDVLGFLKTEGEEKDKQVIYAQQLLYLF